MKALLWALAGLILAVGLTLAARFNNGLVLVVYPPYRVELSLSLFAFASLALFALSYLVVRLVSHMLALPEEVRAFKASRRRLRAREAMDEGLLAWLEGRFAQAEKSAASALAQDEAPAVNALLAARAAHELRAYDRRDAYLAEAERKAPDAAVARLVTQAELALDARQTQNALDALKELERQGHKNAHALRLELTARQQARQWEQVPAVAEALVKREALDPAKAEQVIVNAHVEALKRRADDPAALTALWQKLPPRYRENAKVAAHAARAFLAAGSAAQAQEILEKALAQAWDSELAELYGQCPGEDSLKQLEQAEGWLEAHPRDAALLRTLGRLCLARELWGKAQSYLEASLAVEPGAEAHLLLAQLLEKLERPAEACQHYRASMSHSA